MAPFSPLMSVVNERGLAAALITVLFALIAYRLRGVDLSGAIAGAAISFIIYVAAGPGGFVVLATVFVLAAGTTRMGYARKRQLGVAERKRGRGARQVLANLVAAAACAVAARYYAPQVLQLCMVAALAEAAADTVSGEVGQAFTDRVYLITTLRRVAVGTDGGISVAGTAAGCAAAVLIAVIGEGTHLLPTHWITAAAGAGVLGTFCDSLLGATLQRHGWLGNSGVNLLSTAAAAVLARLLLL